MAGVTLHRQVAKDSRCDGVVRVLYIQRNHVWERVGRRCERCGEAVWDK